MAIKSWKLWTFLSGWHVDERRAIGDIITSWIQAITHWVQKWFKQTLLSVLHTSFSPHIKNTSTISEIWKEIEDTLAKVMNALWNSSSPWDRKTPKIKNILEVKYKIFLYWLVEKFKKRWLTFDIDTLKDIPDKNGESIYNILRDRWLTTFFMLSKSLWLLDYSENIINKFPKEKEIKVLETSYDSIKAGLQKWEKDKKWFRYVEDQEIRVIDTYYDDINLRLDRQDIEGTKRSFRIRKKIYADGTVKSFYTIKRKEPEKKWRKDQGTVESLKSWEVSPRDCFENEFKILEPEIFEGFIEDIWLRESRSKQKKRKSFSIEFDYKWKKIHAKLDIDDYENGIPEFLEIECDDDDAIPYIIKKLGIPKSTVILTCGSRWLFDYYKEKWLLQEEYKKKYKVNEATWEINWENWDTWNAKIHPKIRRRRKKKKH